jgi:transcription elongation GreA/GreB family factor
VAELIKEARSFGDLSENSEYDEAKTEQGKLYSKIAEIQNIIVNAEIIDLSAVGDTITLGSKVTVAEIGGMTRKCMKSSVLRRRIPYMAGYPKNRPSERL